MRELISAMSAMGLIIDGEPILNSEIHRIQVDGKRQKNGWYCGIISQMSGKIYCTFGRWDTGEKVKWDNNGHTPVSSVDLEMLETIAERHKQEKERRQRFAAINAKKIWRQSAEIVGIGYEYLKKKQIQAHIARLYGELIIIPIYNSEGQLVNLQKIWPDGTKKFLYGGEISGCASVINGSGSEICIAEGFATAATIHETTGLSVVIAFNAGNLEKVTRAVREKSPDAEIIICADNDPVAEKLGYSPGLHYGQKAAESVQNARLCFPPCEGMDFNDFAQQNALQAVRQIVMKEGIPETVCCELSDLPAADSISMKIPDSIRNVSGLISDGLKASIAAGCPDIIQYNLPVVFSIIARAIAGKMALRGVWPTLYNVKVGRSSTGKTDADRIFKSAIYRAGIEKFYGPTDFSSGPGLLRGMQDMQTPQCLITLDEVSGLFTRGKDDIVGANKMAVLMELYTADGTPIIKPYGDSSKMIEIRNPCLIMTGNAVLSIFDNIRTEDLTSGLMQRFDFWTYDGIIPYRIVPENEDNEALQRFLSGIARILSVVPPAKSKHDLASLMTAYEMQLTYEAVKRLKEYSIYIVDEANKHISDMENGIPSMISRQYNLSMKYAMIHAASVRPAGCLYDPISTADIEWGISVAEMLCQWKISTLLGKITAGEFHRDCEVFKDAIAAAMRAKQALTLKSFCNRKKRLNELKPREMQEVISALEAKGEIIIETKGKKTFYHLAKQTGE